MTRIAVCLVVLCLVSGLALALPKKPHMINHRSTFNYGAMILCGTKRNPLHFNNYGCFCGFGGKGTPVDDVDRCCQVHDQCYDRLKSSGLCPGIAVYLLNYETTNCLTCRTSSYYHVYGKCKQALCECDAESVKCFNNATYNVKYAKYDKTKC